MHCNIRSMNDKTRGKVDTLPPRGRVNEVRREWLVHADGALANRLQDEEIKQHLTGNKSRNHQIREDFPCAKNEQVKELEEAARVYQEMVLQQEEKDAIVAARLAEVIEKEEEAKRKALETEDEELARALQQKERSRIERRERDRRELESHTPRKDRTSNRGIDRFNIPAKPNFDSDMTDVSNTNRPNNSHSLRSNSSVNNYTLYTPNNNNMAQYIDNLDDVNNIGLPVNDVLLNTRPSTSTDQMYRYTPSPPAVSEEEARRIQEEKDAELARRLQEEESEENVVKLNRDRLLAIETQDKELARLLQEKERVKARRARERAKLKKKQQQEQQQQQQQTVDSVVSDVRTAEVVHLQHSVEPAVRPTELNLKNKCKPRYPDPEEIVELTDDMSNIAMAIDPTYSKPSQRSFNKLEYQSSMSDVVRCTSNQPVEVSTNSPDINLPDPELVEELNAPPYMPIQGQRRLPEKKSKTKDSCKQQ